MLEQVEEKTSRKWKPGSFAERPLKPNLFASSTNGADHERLESVCHPIWQQSTVPVSQRQHRRSGSQLVTGSLLSVHCQYGHPAPHQQITCNTTQYNATQFNMVQCHT